MDNSALIKNKRIIMYFVFGVLLLIAGGSVFVLYGTTHAEGKPTIEWEQREVEFWEIKTINRRFWHKDAKKYCQQLELEGHYDWRLPTLPELEELLDVSSGRRNNAARVGRAIYWSSTPYGGDSRRYWAISFLSDQSAPMEEHNYNDVVCVRTVNQ